MNDVTRRAVVALAAVPALVRPVAAQGRAMPTVAQTQAYLASAPAFELLYRRFSLAWELAVAVLIRTSEITVDRPDAMLQPPFPDPTRSAWPEGLPPLFEVLGAMRRDGGLRDVAYSRVQPLEGVVTPLWRNAHEAYATIGLPVGENPFAETVDSLVHVERAYRSAVDIPEEEPSYLCRVWALKKICEWF